MRTRDIDLFGWVNNLHKLADWTNDREAGLVPGQWWWRADVRGGGEEGRKRDVGIVFRI